MHLILQYVPFISTKRTAITLEEQLMMLSKSVRFISDMELLDVFVQEVIVGYRIKVKLLLLNMIDEDIILLDLFEVRLIIFVLA